MIQFALPFPAIDPVSSRSARSPCAGMRWPISPACSSAGSWRATLVARPALWGGTSPMQPADLDDALFWATFGVILGGARLCGVL